MSVRRSLVFVTAIAVACAAAPDTREVDLGPVMDRARASFHGHDGRFVATHEGQWATVDDDAVSFVAGRRRRTRVDLETTSSARSGAARLEHDGSVSIPRDDGSSEHVRMSPRGLEQSWTYPSRPSISHDLVVRVGTRTRAHGEDTPSGVRFVDDVGGRTVTYDDVAWIDATGSRTPLRARLEGGELVMRVPASVVDRSAYPATLDPTVSTASSVGTPIVGEPGGFTGVFEVVPGKDGGFLVLMEDYRVTNFVTDMVTFSPGELWGVRVSADGALLDPTGFPIKPISDEELFDAGAGWDGSQWLVVFEQYGDFAACASRAATRVSAAGVVLDPGYIRLPCMDGTIRVAFDGQDFLIVSMADAPSNTTNVDGTYISPAGVLKNLSPFSIATGAKGFTPGLACDGVATCLVAYTDAANNVVTKRVGKNAVVDASARTIAAGSLQFLTWDGTNFVLGYNSGGDVWIRRVSPATGDPVDAAVKVGTGILASGASTNGTTLFTWISAGQLYASRFTNGSVVDVTPIAVTTAASASKPSGFDLPFAGGSAGQFLTAWRDFRSSPYPGGSIYGARVTSAGQTPDGAGGVVLRKAANGQRDPAIAGDGAKGWLAAWEDTRAGEIYATRIDTNGQPLDPSGLLVAAAGTHPSVASSGTGFITTWHQGTDLEARLVSNAGALATPFTVFSGDNYSAATFDGTNYLVAHGYEYSDTTGATRISTAGAVLGTTSFSSGGEVAIASSGTESMVVTSGSWDVLASRIGADGTLLDPAPIVVAPPGNWPIRGPAVGWDGTNYVAAWMDLRDSPEAERKSSVRYARISKAGARLDPVGGRLVNARSTAQMFPAVIGMGDGQNALIAWSDNRRTDRKDEFDLFGAIVRSSDGAVLDPDSFVISNGIGNEHRPAFAPRAAASVIAAYYHVDPTAGLGIERVRTRFIGSGALVATQCTADVECATRACTDGVCCEATCRGSCQKCDASGKCGTVVSADDPDSCTADKTCDPSAKCLVKPGRSCTKADECTTGVCSSGVCCDRACDAACETCTASPGKCELRPARSTGIPSCEPFACEGKTNACPKACANDSACPSGSRCDVGAKACISGAVCLDDQTIGGVGEPASCAPYRCESTACRTTCRGIQDCVYPALCDESGHCTPPSTTPAFIEDSGCATAPRPRGTSAPWSAALGLLALLALRARSGTRCRGRSG